MKKPAKILLIVVILALLGFLVILMKDTIAFKLKDLTGHKSAFTDYKVQKDFKNGIFRVEIRDLVTSTGNGLDGKQYFRYDISIETTDKQGAQEIQDNADQVAALLNSVMTAFRPEDLTTPGQRGRLKTLMADKITEHYPKIKIKDMYFTNYVYN